MAELNSQAAASSSYPPVTVAVCATDRTPELERCLRSLLYVDYPNLDILVVDNASPDRATERLVEGLQTVRYVRENRPGIEHARQRAIRESRGEILAFADEDAVVDHGWVKRLVARERYNESAREHSPSSTWNLLRDRLRSLAGRPRVGS